MFDANLSMETIENMIPWERQIYIGLYKKERRASKADAKSKK